MSSGAAAADEASQRLDAPPESNGSTAAPASSSKLSRKRTKTGCLTCRKRRIKCGEERPICNNCIKSKRHCEGYNQRVVFKPPTMDWRNAQQAGAEMIPYHSGMIPGRPSMHAMQPSMMAPNLQLAHIRPRPSTEFDFSALDSDHSASMEPLSGGGLEPLNSPYRDQFSNVAMPESPFQPPTPFYAQHIAGHHPQEASHHIHGLPTPAYAQLSSPQGLNGSRPAEINNQMHQGTLAETPFGVISPTYDLATSMSYAQIPVQAQASMPTAESKPVFIDHQIPSPIPTLSRRSTQQFGVTTDGWRSENMQGPLPSPALSQGRGSDPRHGDFNDAKQFGHQASRGPSISHPGLDQRRFEGQILTRAFEPHLVSPTQVLDEAAVELEDDDYYDVDVNDDMDVDVRQALPPGSDSQRAFGTMLALHRANTDDISVRRYDAFLYEGILDFYRPERVASPLKNPKTARVFAHFIHATGPSLSIFERNPRNASALFSDTPVPSSQQSLWTYTLPMMALHHQGLLHAMLALASLHIARLQGASVTPSFKHYAYALKRIHHCVGHLEKRHLVSTVAASLLLGYYEVITGDQLKWSSHLIGAKQLIVEIDFPGMVKEYKRVKTEKAAEQAAAERAAYGMVSAPDYAGISQNPFGFMPKSDPANDGSVDESLISTLIGRKVRYDEFGRIVDDSTGMKRPYNPKIEQFDPAKFEALQDLYWFYCKQDMYQSLLGGDSLLMDFDRWSDCPPRCAIGRGDEAYGTFDHLSLLLARIADFAARDRKRKIKAVQASGSSWRPPPNMQFPGLNGRPPTPSTAGPSPFSPTRPNMQSDMPPPKTPVSQTGFSTQRSPVQPPPSQIPFYGMAPLPPQRMPPSYGRADASPITASSPKLHFDPAAALEAAMDEWTQIRSALNIFASHLGPSFQPLSAEFHQPIPTPFGDALQYRSYDIGVLWALYHMAHIIVIRSHPAMPPAAMMAAGVAASQTAPIANLIGRITAGIVPSPPNVPLNPSLGAALIESTMALFFAGIQYIDPSQRAWLVTRVRDVEARTGWASVGLIGSGCETAWVKAAEAGRGPPYERVRDRTSTDERISGITMEDTSEPPKDPSDRRFVQVNKGTRLHWAIGILGLEEDVPKTPID